MAKINWKEKAKEVKHSDPYDARIKQLEARILEFEKRLSVLENKFKGVV